MNADELTSSSSHASGRRGILASHHLEMNHTADLAGGSERLIVAWLLIGETEIKKCRTT